MKKIAIVLVVLVLAVVVYFWDGEAPEVEWIDAPEVLGPNKAIALTARDAGKGLAEVVVEIEQGGQSEVIFRESMARDWTPWARGTDEQSLAITPLSELESLELREGEFLLRVKAADHPNLYFFGREGIEERRFRYDASPPVISVLSSQHSIRQGGAEAVVFQVDENIEWAGVEAGGRRYRAYPLAGPAANRYGCIFALPYDAPTNTAFRIRAEDVAGNSALQTLNVNARARRYRKRRINVSRDFVKQVAPEILTQAGLQQPESIAETFLLVNSRMRAENHARIAEIAASSSGQLLFDEAFVQLANSKVEAPFADDRTYLFEGQGIDRQTHLGFDLATTANAAVEAANHGTVLLAEYLGIYGNCIILDHGFGLISLYGHLSAIEVEVGDRVERRQIIGRTGQTGLAAGDHLHFAIFAQRTAVNPLEWWDPSWVETHIFARLAE